MHAISEMDKNLCMCTFNGIGVHTNTTSATFEIAHYLFI
jgi:hypothetical protein